MCQKLGGPNFFFILLLHLSIAIEGSLWRHSSCHARRAVGCSGHRPCPRSWALGSDRVTTQPHSVAHASCCARTSIVCTQAVSCVRLGDPVTTRTPCHNREPEFFVVTENQKWAVAHPFLSFALETLFHAFPPLPLSIPYLY